MSDFDTQFAESAVPAMAQHLGDTITRRIQGQADNTDAIEVIVDRGQEQRIYRESVQDGHGARANADVILEILTPADEISPAIKTGDIFVLPDSALATAVIRMRNGSDGNYPAWKCSLYGGLTSSSPRVTR